MCNDGGREGRQASGETTMTVTTEDWCFLPLLGRLFNLRPLVLRARGTHNGGSRHG
jgi:hypothetical protein